MGPSTQSSNRQDEIPQVVFSMGDPNGIGPEITLKALQVLLKSRSFKPIIAGNNHCLRKTGEEMSISIPWEQVEIVEAGDRPFQPAWGRKDKAAGELAFSSLQKAVEICRGRNIPSLVTAPVNKESLIMAGFRYPGQTEYLAAAFSSQKFCMAFLSNSFHLLLATIHIPLSQVPAHLDHRDLFEKCCLFHQALSRILASPRIAVCGLNPHASENGVFGDEENRIILPAVKELKTKFGDSSFSGPYPPDTVFNKTSSGQFDAVVAMYHDQGLIHLKLLAFESAVNTTLGLPVYRTSPAHGTAFDIAGHNLANPGSMIAAVGWGLQMAYPHKVVQAE